MKEYNVIVDIDAEEDLFDVYSYVALNDSVEQADKLFSSLRRTCYKLKTLPLRGNIPPELSEIGVIEFRELHFKISHRNIARHGLHRPRHVFACGRLEEYLHAFTAPMLFAQCERTTQRDEVMRWRVTPPSAHSRSRECP